MGYDDKQVARIEGYVEKINKEISDSELLKYSVELTIDRVLLYLNHEKLDEKFERIIADVVDSVFMRYAENLKSETRESAISRVQDGGQSISYSNEMKSYFITASDRDLFGGCIDLLSRYRRVNVVNPQKSKGQDS